MKQIPLLRIILICTLYFASFGLFGQHTDADKKIFEIESFKKYEIIKIDDKEGLKMLSDSTVEVTGMVNYLRKSNINRAGKVTESSRSVVGMTERTYYFNDRYELFAIIDFIRDNTNVTRKLTYYFGSGELKEVLDENRKNVTTTIDKQQLYHWIRRMFTDDVIAK